MPSSASSSSSLTFLNPPWGHPNFVSHRPLPRCGKDGPAPRQSPHNCPQSQCKTLSDYSHTQQRQLRLGSSIISRLMWGVFFIVLHSTPIACTFPIHVFTSIPIPFPLTFTLPLPAFPRPAMVKDKSIHRCCCHIARPKVSNLWLGRFSWSFSTEFDEFSLRVISMGNIFDIVLILLVSWEVLGAVFRARARSMRALD